MDYPSNLNIVSYNSTGLGITRMEYIKEFIEVENVDLLLLQETWLTSGNIDRLADINDNFMYHGVSGIDNCKILCGRPLGGVAILWKQEYANYVNKVDICRRACGVTIYLW